MNDSSSSGRGIGFLGLLFIVLLVLAIWGKISAWWLLIPAIPLIIVLLFFGGIGIFMALVMHSMGKRLK